MLKDDLIEYGLDDKEAQLYLSLLELGEASVLNIARKSGLKRTTVYHLLESLKNRGFVGITTRKRKKLYFSQSPRKLEAELMQKQTTLKKMMPELMSLANLIDKKPRIQFFEGVGGIKTVLEDELETTGHEMMGWWTEGYLKVVGEEYFSNHFNPKRIGNKIYFRSIVKRSEHYEFLQKLSVEKLWNIKMGEFESFNLETDIILYGNSKISVISYDEKIALIIESVKLHNTLKAIFEMQWNSIPEQNHH